MTTSELAERMSCEPSNATYVIDKLEKQKLVERRPHPTDRRARQLVLTADGSALRGKLLELLQQDSPLAGLAAHEQDALHDLLQRARTRR
jgi:DNA-binding MarR family transcriptional regulator